MRADARQGGVHLERQGGGLAQRCVGRERRERCVGREWGEGRARLGGGSVYLAGSGERRLVPLCGPRCTSLVQTFQKNAVFVIHWRR